jgi:hypothetical protein
VIWIHDVLNLFLYKIRLKSTTGTLLLEKMDSKASGYSVDSNIMATSGSKDIDAITIATIKLKSQEREYEIVDDPIGRIKLKNYSSDDSSLVHEKPLVVYYCALCGAHVLVTTEALSGMKIRRTDKAIIIPDQGNMKFQRYFTAGKTVVIRRADGLEKQWRWVCRDCGVCIAYQCIPHDHHFSSELTKPTVTIPRKLEDTPDYQSKAKQPECFYIMANALATDAAFSELVTEIQKRGVLERPRTEA